jgi:hypothetical protein
MAKLEQNRFASILRLLQLACPRDWQLHLRNMGVSASADLPPAELDRIMDRVSWMVRQTGIKDPAAWIAFDMARVEAAPASVKPEAPLKVALPVAVRQNPVELEPVKLRTALAKTSVASPLALETGIKDPAAWIATDMPGVKTASASVEPEAPLKVALPVAVRQNPVELEPVKLRTAPAKTSNASPMALEKAIVIARLLSQAKLAIEADRPREAAADMYVAYEIHGASQQQIAAAVGKSQAWVSCMIQWRREGLKDTPFGPASKEERMWARFRRLTGLRMPRKILLSRWRKPQMNPGGRGESTA